MLGGKRGDPIALLILASLLRDSLPWMYELGIEAYRMAKDGTPEEAIAARRRFQKAAEVVRRGPFAPEEMGFDPHMMHIMMREMDHLLEVNPELESMKEVAAPPAPKSKRKKGREAGVI